MMKFFDSNMTVHFDQVTKNSRPSNDLSDDNEPDLRQNSYRRSLSTSVKPKEASKIAN